ncbi:YncE family protein [Actinoplanes sp. NPDC000266]
MYKLRAAMSAVAVACTATVSVVAMGASPAAAGPPTLTDGVVLPITHADRVVVDPVHKRVIVSDKAAGKVLWLSYFGGVQTQISQLPGVDGMALSPDYSTLWLAGSGTDEILAYDTEHPTEKRSYPRMASPGTVALAGGKVWYGTADYLYQAGEQFGGFASLDLETEYGDWGELPARIHGAPELIVPPNDPNTLVVADRSTNTATSGKVAVYDVSGAKPVLKGSGKFSPGLLNGIEAYGSSLIGFGFGCPIWKAPLTAPATTATAYNNGICRPQSVDANADGRVAFGYGNTDATPDIAISPAGSELPVEQYVAPGGEEVTHVAWEPGGDRLFALSRSGQQVKFYPIHGSEPVRPALTVKAPVVANRGAALDVTGTINVPGAVVSLSRTDLTSPNGTGPVDSAVADAQGRFTLTDSPPAGGTVTYKVTYQGDDTHAPASATASVEVSRNATSLALSPNNTINAYGSTVTVTARLGTTYANRAVQIWADPYGTEPLRLVRWTNVDAKGNLTASLKLTRTTAVLVKFLGDAQYAPAAVRTVLNTRASVTLQPSRQYKAAKIGTVPYRYYHANVHPYFLTTINPYAGRKQRLTLETFTAGKWKVWRVLDLPLNSAGQSAFTLTGTHPVGAKYRVRAGYLTTTSGDSVNYTNYSPYYYFTFTK